MDRKKRFHLMYVIVAIWGIVILQNLFVQFRRVDQIPYSQFQTYLEEGQIDEISITNTHIRGTLRSPPEGASKRFVTVRVEPELADKLAAQDVEFTGVLESTWVRDLLSWVLPVLLFVAIWMFIIRRVVQKSGGLGGGFMSIGKSKAKVYVEDETKVTFADVAGVDEAKEELREIVEFLRDPRRYGRLGGRLPKGILLVGPPGTGKTLLARATAGEAAVPFFSISGSEFVEMFVGVGAARVRDLFEQAMQRAPSIIFIDELDALGRARGLGHFGGGHDEKEQTLNQLLVEMDGFDPRQGMLILGSTNRPEVLDPALLRAGRFDRQVLVDRPDKTGRVAILDVHMKNMKVGSDVAREQIAALTPGFTGADLANLVNEAALLATRRNADAITMDDFTRAVERIVAGLEKKNRLLNPRERERVAYHEMGHTLVAMALPGSDPVHKVSIIPRGISALGYTIQRPTEDRYLMSREELENKMAVLLGGRMAETLVFDDISTGAADDLAKATDIARSMVTRYGMYEKLGLATYEEDVSPFLHGVPMLPRGRKFSEETAREIDCAVRAILDAASGVARTILEDNRGALDRGAGDLLEKETLNQDELPRLEKPHDASVHAARAARRAPNRGAPPAPAAAAAQASSPPTPSSVSRSSKRCSHTGARPGEAPE
ncbi:MAG: ATP-dependent zinc metalloprotease FtsH [Candidatus Krumholzibacteriia bacterium]